MMQIAFYKGKGSAFNSLIRWWTRSPYSHVELIIDGVWYSSSHTDGGVRSRVINHNPLHWDFIDVPFDAKHALNVFDGAKHYKYDWLGIALSQAVALDWHTKDRYFCSELVAEMLGFSEPQRYSPGSLFNKFKE